MTAEIKPNVATPAVDTKPLESLSSHVTHKTKAVVKKDTASSSIISGTNLDKKGEEKTLGNPGWPSKIENPINVPSSSTQTIKGM